MLRCCFFFFKQKTAYEMRISDWSSDVCSSDLGKLFQFDVEPPRRRGAAIGERGAHVGKFGEHARQQAELLKLAFEQGRVRAGVQIGRASCRERVCQSV